MTPAEAAALFVGGRRPAAPRVKLAVLLFERARQGLQFSRDMLRYGVGEDGKYGDGSPMAQGSFLLAYQKLPWRYDGSKWPGTGAARPGRINMGPAR